MNKTAIQWTDLTSNPIQFHDADGNRHPSLNEAELRAILRYRVKGPGEGTSAYRNGARPMVFVCDMTDMFAPWVTDAMLDRMFAVFALRPDIIFQVLTKRPERMREYLTGARVAAAVAVSLLDWEKDDGKLNAAFKAMQWPLPNVWLGTTAENQDQADIRIPQLLATPAAVRFVSYEPALGPVDLDWAFPRADTFCCHQCRRFRTNASDSQCFNCGGALGPDIGIDWVICGGESGAGARPFDLAWARSVRDQCASAGVPFFMKQLGAEPFCSDWQRGRDSETYLFGPIKLKDGHGGHPDEWPADLRVRQWPGGAR